MSKSPAVIDTVVSKWTAWIFLNGDGGSSGDGDDGEVAVIILMRHKLCHAWIVTNRENILGRLNAWRKKTFKFLINIAHVRRWNWMVVCKPTRSHWMVKKTWKMMKCVPRRKCHYFKWIPNDVYRNSSSSSRSRSSMCYVCSVLPIFFALFLLLSRTSNIKSQIKLKWFWMLMLNHIRLPLFRSTVCIKFSNHALFKITPYFKQ